MISEAGNFGQLPDEMIIEILGNFISSDEVWPFLVSCRKIYDLWQNIINIGKNMVIIKIPHSMEGGPYLPTIINGKRDQFITTIYYVTCKNIFTYLQNKQSIKVKSGFIIGKMIKRRNKEDIRQLIELGKLSFYITSNVGIVKCDNLSDNFYQNNMDNIGVGNYFQRYEVLKKEVKNKGLVAKFYTYSRNFNSEEFVNIDKYLEGW